MIDGFFWRLIGAFSLGVVVAVDEFEKIAVEDLRGFRCGLRVLDERRCLFEEIGAPWVAWFIENRVGEDVVEENVLRDIFRSWEGFTCPEGETEVFGQEVGGEGFAVGLRHMFDC